MAIADGILKLSAVKAAIAIMNDVLKCDPLAATDFILPYEIDDQSVDDQQTKKKKPTSTLSRKKWT